MRLDRWLLTMTVKRLAHRGFAVRSSQADVIEGTGVHMLYPSRR